MPLRNRLHVITPLMVSALFAWPLVGCPGALDSSFDATDAAMPSSTTTSPLACPDVPSTTLATSCAGAGCHGATGAAAGLDLVSPDIAVRLTGKAASQGGLLLDPSSPTTSVLYEKLSASPPFGSRMPLGGTPLDDKTMTCIASWIAGLNGTSTPAPVAPDGGTASTPPSNVEAGAMSPDGAAVNGFTPSSLPNTVIWLDAAQGVTSSGTRVSAWSDQSPKHNDAAQTSDGNRPTLSPSAINGHAALTFDESRETFVSIPDADSLRWGTGGFAIAIVAANRKATAGRHHGGGVSTVFAKPQQGGATEVTFHLNWFTDENSDDDGKIQVGVGEGDPGQESTTGGYNDGKARVYVARVTPNGNGSDYELFVNGAAAGKSHDTTIDVTLTGSPVRIGSTYSQSMQGDIAEVVAVKGALADGDLATLTTYLIRKYGITP